MANRPSLIVAAISAIATFTLVGSGMSAASSSVWQFFIVVVPLLSVVLADTRGLPDGRPRAGDRHLKIYDERDNLWAYATTVL
jgi:hypothetical protein